MIKMWHLFSPYEEETTKQFRNILKSLETIFGSLAVRKGQKARLFRILLALDSRLALISTG